MGDVLSQGEVKQIIRALLATRCDRGATKAEMQKVVDWAEDARIGATLLRLLLGGHIGADVNEAGEVTFPSSGAT